MTMAENFTEQADAILDGDLSSAHVDVQSLAATYEARRDSKDPRAGVFARALVKRARGTGYEVVRDSLPVADLRAEIDRRNEDRDDDAKIVVTGTGKSGRVTKDDLLAALAADDQRE